MPNRGRTFPLKPKDLAAGVRKAEYQETAVVARARAMSAQLLQECLERVQRIMISSRTFSEVSGWSSVYPCTVEREVSMVSILHFCVPFQMG